MKPVRTTCPYCGVGCGIVARRTGKRTADIAGDPDHPANRGKLCSKGTHLGDTVGLDGRLLYPMIGSGRVSWDEALGLVADTFAKTIAEHGPDSVAFYVSGQLLTEDYYVANKLMKGFIGSGNIDTNSRLCMASAVAAHVRSFGEDVVPCSYSDLDEADLIVLVGSNTAWCHPIVWQRIDAARTAHGTKLIVIDPRRTETAEQADLHLAIAPDTDVALFEGLLRNMREIGKLDDDFLAKHVTVPEGFWNGIGTNDTAAICGVDAADLDYFFSLFAGHDRTVTLFSQGVNQSVGGTDKANAIINLHVATGRIGKAGAGPFSITGQPNAMGGREVGGMASTLAVHMNFSEAERSRAQRFWNSPVICSGPGLKAVDMFRSVAEGKIKAIWIMATNPAVSMADARAVRAALASCPFVVVSDCIAETDTMKFAHVRLPALAWGEKDGAVTNSERVISRQRKIFDEPGNARPDWWAMAEVGKKMGWPEGFQFTTSADVFREFARQTGFENDGARLLDISALAETDDDEYEKLEPFQWGGRSPLAHGRFPTADGRAMLVATTAAEQQNVTPELPMRLNTGRYRDHWHTMTRTGLSAKLSQHRREPLVEVHPSDAERLEMPDGGLAFVETESGSSVFRVSRTVNQRPGEIFVPIHWTDLTSSGGRTGDLVSSRADPISGQPGFKNTLARITPYVPQWTGFLVMRDNPGNLPCAYWTAVRDSQGWVLELAGDGDPTAILNVLPEGQRAEAVDRRRGMIRAVVTANGAMSAALFITGEGRLPTSTWLGAQMGLSNASPTELLAGRPAIAPVDFGAVVCVCFGVGETTIRNAVDREGLSTVQDIGVALRAGTNCGSCRPALARLLQAHAETAPA